MTSSSKHAAAAAKGTPTLWTRKLEAFEQRLDDNDRYASHLLSSVHAHAGYSDTGAALVGMLLDEYGRPRPKPRVWSVPRRASIGPDRHPHLDLVLYAQDGADWCRFDQRTGKQKETEAERIEREAERIVEWYSRESRTERFAYDWYVLFDHAPRAPASWVLTHARNPWHAFVKPDYDGDERRVGARPTLEYIGTWTEFRDRVASDDRWPGSTNSVAIDDDVPRSAWPDCLRETLERGSAP